jgi:hypothetical protein
VVALVVMMRDYRATGRLKLGTQIANSLIMFD